MLQHIGSLAVPVGVAGPAAAASVSTTTSLHDNSGPSGLKSAVVRRMIEVGLLKWRVCGFCACCLLSSCLVVNHLAIQLAVEAVAAL